MNKLTTIFDHSYCYLSWASVPAFFQTTHNFLGVGGEGLGTGISPDKYMTKRANTGLGSGGWVPPHPLDFHISLFLAIFLYIDTNSFWQD